MKLIKLWHRNVTQLYVVFASKQSIEATRKLFQYQLADVAPA